ncbi:MAG: hypothetical protein EPN93_14495 [Spirochaetes bacterium]|nr:MAG: hypothetical protein EPN93_14495 [Spirochaetota bacterium]
MKKFLIVLTLIGLIATSGPLAALEMDPNLDMIYSGASFSALLKFDINDQLQAVYFSAKGDKWLEYEIIGNDYAGEGKGWVYKVQDGMGNQYTIKRPGLDSNITMSGGGGKPVTLVRKK